MAQHIATIQEIRDRTVAQEQHISDDDLLPFDHGTGSKRHRAFTVGEIIAYIKANKLDGMTIGTTAEIKTSSGNPVIVNFYAIDAGTIEAKTKFKVGGSEWVPGNQQPKLDGLHDLITNNVVANNAQIDSITSVGGTSPKIEIKKLIVRDATQAAEALQLGPTEVNGTFKATDEIDAFGGLKLSGYAKNASVQITCGSTTYSSDCGRFYVGDIIPCSKHEQSFEQRKECFADDPCYVNMPNGEYANSIFRRTSVDE